MESEALAWAVMVPLGGAVCALLAPRRASVAVGLAASLATAIAALAVSWEVWQAGTLVHAIGGWAAPLGIALRADGLAAMMLLMSGVVGAFVSLYAAGYFSRAGAGEREGRWRPADAFWPLWLLLSASLVGLFLSGDIFNVYVALELVTLAGIGLMILNGERIALAAGMRYLLAAFLASLLYLFGVAILYAAHDALDLRVLAERLQAGPPAVVAAVLITTGLLLKTAVFPLHFWLPAAHANAAAPVSAILSALVIKASFYLLLRFWFDLFPAVLDVQAGQVLGILGMLAIVWGSVQAIRQHRLKLVIAYSTVAQVGYLMLIVPLAFGRSPGSAASMDAWVGGLLLALTHGLAKAAMFMSAGALMQGLGTDRLERFAGVAERMPVSLFAFGIAGMSLIGLPPSGGFTAKWLLIRAAILSDAWWWAAVVLVGGLLTAAYVFLVLGIALTRVEAAPPWQPPAHGRLMDATALTLALLSLALGLRTTEPLELARIGNPFGF